MLSAHRYLDSGNTRQASDGECEDVLRRWRQLSDAPPHQEIDVVFTVVFASFPHFCFFFPDVKTGDSNNSKTEPQLPFDASRDFKNFTVIWTPTRLALLVNNMIYRDVKSGPGINIPTIPGFIKLILRPTDSKFLGTAALLHVRSLSFEKLADQEASPLKASSDGSLLVDTRRSAAATTDGEGQV